MSKKSENGTIRYMWEGKNGTYWALFSYWVGTGWQIENKALQARA